MVLLLIRLVKKSLFLVLILRLFLYQECAHATQLAKLVPADPITDGWFGISVALADGLALVGANPLVDPAGVFGPGSAYLFGESGAGQWQQIAQLVPSDSFSGDRFGDSVALSGDIAVIGATTGYGATQRVGSAYVFEKTDSGIWTETAKLTSPTPFEFNGFGKSVAIDGDTVVIGAGGDTAPIGEMGGRAYVFRRDTVDNWNLISTLKASDAEKSDGFSYPTIGISENRIIVGAYLDDNVAYEAGSAYIFEEDVYGQWNEVAKLIASDAASLNRFGWSVDISGDTAVVGSLQGGDYGDRSGTAYVFQDDGSGTWIELTKLIPSDGSIGAGFGRALDISGDLIVAGALTDDFGQFTGSAFAFRRDQFGNWIEVAKLLADDAAGGDHFGNEVSINGDDVLVGAWVDDYSGYMNVGSAYLFRVPIPEPPASILAVLGFALACTRQHRPRKSITRH